MARVTINTAEAAAMLGVSTATIRTLTKCGELTAYRIGGENRYYPEVTKHHAMRLAKGSTEAPPDPSVSRSWHGNTVTKGRTVDTMPASAIPQMLDRLESKIKQFYAQKRNRRLRSQTAGGSMIWTVTRSGASWETWPPMPRQ